MEDVTFLDETTEMNKSSNDDDYDEDENENENENETIEEPKLGMAFSSREDVYDYYKNYAKKQGFGVAKNSSKCEDDGVIKYFTIQCSRAGKSSVGKTSLRPNLSSKTECKAKIRSTWADESYELTTVASELVTGWSESDLGWWIPHSKPLADF